jgi:hypothetical protein
LVAVGVVAMAVAQEDGDRRGALDIYDPYQIDPDRPTLPEPEIVDEPAPVHVAVGGDLTNGCGALASPCGSITKGLDVAWNSRWYSEIGWVPRTVLISVGDYAEPLRLSLKGTRIQGGWASDFATPHPSLVTTIIAPANTPAIDIAWASSAQVSGVTAVGGAGAPGIKLSGSFNVIIGAPGARTTVIGGAGDHATGLLLDSKSSARIEHASIDSGRAVGVAATAYAIRVVQSSQVRIRDSRLTAQAGQAAAPANPTRASLAGVAGQAGGPACGPNCPGTGGTGGNLAWGQPWDPRLAPGGSGGTGGNYSSAGNWGADSMNRSSGGPGGCGSTTGCLIAAGGGRTWFGSGVGGLGGGGGDHNFQTSDRYSSVPHRIFGTGNGKDGADGSNGAGGGGGGGGSSASASGGGGGGGGSGGQGGGGGTMGNGGGGSFGVYAVNSGVDISYSTIVVSVGGAGSPGGNGGNGGNGGAGGRGGAKSCCEASGGGGGGAGWPGSGGGGGGGGAGGPSIGLFLIGSGGFSERLNTINLPTSPAPGANGGAAGLSGNSAKGGAGGGCALINWRVCGDAGQSSPAGQPGSPGSAGRAGLVARVWNNGAPR